MKTLSELCIPRESVFDESKRDDVLDLTDLMENRINSSEFFEENYLTDGMKILFETAFKRFHRQGVSGLVKLTQSMGGGKTHNMIALGLLARYPELRQKVLGNRFKDTYVGKVKVVAFTGRESDTPFGIWGAIAEQLGKKEDFSQYYAPLAAPGQNAWIKLLQGEPLLIMLDELPPYLENARSKVVGNSDLAVVTTNALANLFVALGKEELSNVCVVISDLKATYEAGSELLASSFKELEGEVNRSALPLEPVGSASDEVYQILKKRLFAKLPNEVEIKEIALAYKKTLTDAKQMGYASMTPDQIYIGVTDAYPFHPAIKDLYARFKENEGFQQTRGLLRLMRRVVDQLYRNENLLAQQKYLVNVYDIDLNDREMLTAVSQIKPSLINAISHDIAESGKAVAEGIDSELGGSHSSDLSKLLLMASLADVPNSLLGLSSNEILTYLCEPGKDLTQVRKALDEFTLRAWYLYTDQNERYFFRNTKNLIAELNSLVQSYDYESARKELRAFLEEKFKSSLGDCYQLVQVFPGIDEINLAEDKVSLILFEPYPPGGLHPELQAFYNDTHYQNRVMFLSGQRTTMDKLLQAAKEYKAIQVILGRMVEDKVPEKNPQYQKAVSKSHKLCLNVLQSARETFMTLYYPSKKGVTKADFMMEFRDNNYRGEGQIRSVLLDRQKFTEDISGEVFRNKCEDRLFTQKEMRWSDIKERAATNATWQWHIPRALDDLKNELLKKGVWRENGGYIEKPPFPKPDTDVLIQEISRDRETGEAILKIVPQHGDQLFYEIDVPATTASLPVQEPNRFKTSELKLSFLCVDSKGEHATGAPREWTNKITLQYKIYDQGNDKVVLLRSAPNADIKYTTDGSSPREYGGVYLDDFVLTPQATHVLAVAEKDGVISELLTIKVDRRKGGGLQIDKEKALTLNRKIKTSDTASTYREIELLKKHQANLSDVLLILYKTDEKLNEKGWLELSMDPSTLVGPDKLEKEIGHLRDNFMGDGRVNMSLEFHSTKFKTGQHFEDWIADKRLSRDDFKEQEIIQ